MSVRLVATDLDGTLVHSDGSITARTRAALVAAENAGVDVVFVTGRPLRWAEDVFEHVGGHGFAIVSNGALLWDVTAAAPALERPIPVATILEVAALLRAAVPGSHFAVETVDGIALETGFLERYPVPDGARRGPLDEIARVPAYKLLVRHEELGPQEFWDAAELAVGHLVEIVWSSTTTMLEVSARGVTKASTLERFCGERGIAAAEVVAFGDMPNDIPMLAWAGTSYAMANAHPTVQAIATRLAPPSDEDGVAQVIESILDSRSSTPAG
ncbi:HAD family phosphatase [Nocardioides marmoriginsengisoli]|uniref:HAD family phosphatase n=1 Tax=Nocardioides marmoriginsengisoli TaxID=661483 RepID=A0A3N0CF57_9ACTN|nr:Cof-type HAD-IIB family hydrolase [Nocardioides marmoriginsengisoli]RNL62068.1 HAD family phosphatase [Nocardioides marmoriginsengisoli]